MKSYNDVLKEYNRLLGKYSPFFMGSGTLRAYNEFIETYTKSIAFFGVLPNADHFKNLDLTPSPTLDFYLKLQYGTNNSE